ncbi:MAG: methionine--tRNA ligase [Tissierellia bacterium]|nr:methionine--tRNA ligase [Tissierellia bacterium]
MGKTFYVTTPIYYPSDNLHIGHTYCTVAADAIKKFKKLQGYDVYMVTGSDEHGQKIEEKAKEVGVSPKEYVDKIVADTKELWSLLDIEYDSFIRSTDPIHEKNVQELFQKLYDKGEIYKDEYEGFYCTPCEAFWAESQMDKDHNCPDCGRPTHMAKEESYFFRLSKYRDALLEYYDNHPEFIQPEFRKKEMINNFLKEGLDDLSVTRSSFDWGVPVPFDKDHIVYVWIDALSCYLSGLGLGTEDESNYEKFWPAQVHLVGKEIMRFHTIIWPALLMALEIPLPEKIFGHGWILFDDDKMSKSKGNVVYPEPIIELYGVDALKYFLLREFSFGNDGNFNKEKFMNRLNSDLANDLGNLLSRTVSMIEKYCNGILPEPGESNEFDKDLETLAPSIWEKNEKAMEHFQFSVVLDDIWKLVRRTNKYVDETTPWIVAKEGDQKRLDTIMYHLAESLRVISILIYPYLQNTAKEIRNQLGLPENISWEDGKVWGLSKAGNKITKGKIIFPRLDTKKEMEKLEKANTALFEKRMKEKEKDMNEEVKGKDLITIDDFDKCEIKVALVESVEDHPNADRLYILHLKIGEEKRQIVSSIKEYYKPEDLEGKKILVLTNLKPAKFRGVESNGMLLAAEDDEGNLTIASTLEDIVDGASLG